MVRLAASLVLAAALAAGPARADGDALARAREAVAAVRYDQARALLVEALRRGGSSPDELAEIYRLSASTATVLGERELAEQFYRRWLALEPAAALPDSVAPKLREPFVAAQAHMAAHGRLRAAARWVARDELEVVIEADPLAMVAAVALDDAAAAPLGAGRARLRVPAGAAFGHVVVLDEFRNRLLELPRAAIAPFAEPVTGGDPVFAPAEPPLHRRPLVWVAPAAVAAGLGLGFGLAARRADADVDAIVANSGMHFFDDLARARDRRDRNALVANLAFAAAGAFAVTAAVMYALRPAPVRATTVVATGAGLAVAGTW